jgi:hypothetical protein
VYEKRTGSSVEIVTLGSKPIVGAVMERGASGSNTVNRTVGYDDVRETRNVGIYKIASFLIVDGIYITSRTTEERRLDLR